MSLLRCARILPIVALATSFTAAGAADLAGRAEFAPAGRDHEAQFARAAAELSRLIQNEGYDVVAVADFTDIDGRPLHIGRVFAAEFSTLLVNSATGRKRARVLDPTAIADFMADKEDGGGNPLASNKALKQFGKRSDAELLLSGKIEITPKELRLFLRAVVTKTANIQWASTVVVQGTAAGYAEKPKPVSAPTSVVAAPQPVVAPATAAPVASAPVVAAPAAAAPPASSTASLVAAPAITSLGAAPVVAAPVIAAPTIAAPAAAAPAAAAAPKPAAAAPAPQTLFDNGVVRAQLRSAQKYEASGWVTAVIDITNLSTGPLALDVSQNDPGSGTDDLGNAWKVERVSGLKFAESPSAEMTSVSAQGTVPVVLVLSTSARPMGNMLSFTANVLWYSTGIQDGGRLGMNFQNIKL